MSLVKTYFCDLCEKNITYSGNDAGHLGKTLAVIVATSYEYGDSIDENWPHVCEDCRHAVVDGFHKLIEDLKPKEPQS